MMTKAHVWLVFKAPSWCCGTQQLQTRLHNRVERHWLHQAAGQAVVRCAMQMYAFSFDTHVRIVRKRPQTSANPLRTCYENGPLICLITAIR